MSGGQKQRVMIAMALSCNPQLLIADEPTTALDVTIQAQILEILRKLRDERGMAIIFITHDLGVIAEIADDVLVMFQGQEVEYGPVLEIFGQPKHPYTKGLLACRPRLETKYRRLPTVDDFMETVRENGDVRVIEKKMDAARLKHLEEAGRGRLLHPKSELAGIGHPWEEGHHAPDTQTVAEGTKPLLAVENLQVHFPVRRGILARTVDHIKAVDGISFNVYRGQTLGLVGESGCGKTTTGRAILRLIEPTGGRVAYDGVDLGALGGGELRAMRGKMQIVFQDPYGSLNPRMTIETGAHRADGDPRHRQQPGASGATGPPSCSKKSAWNRATCAATRTNSPAASGSASASPARWRPSRSFIICDESVSSLDVSVQAQVLNLLKDLQEKRGLTYIFISHDLSVVKFMADMMAVMNDGKIVEFGPSENIYANPREDYTRRLIEATPKDDIELIRRRVAERAQSRVS